MKIQRLIVTCLALMLTVNTYAIDYDKYKKRKARQQIGVMEAAKKAADDWEFDKAEELLEKAQNMSYAPDKIKSVKKVIKTERFVKSEKERKEREALAEKKRKERLARKRQREREERASKREYASNGFRGVSKNQCYRMSEYGPQQVCLNGTGGNACYGLKDYGLREMCLNGAGGNACYGIKNYAFRETCLKGIRSDACYAFTDYNKSNSCRKFSGSTEFWIIFASFGYYTY